MVTSSITTVTTPDFIKVTLGIRQSQQIETNLKEFAGHVDKKKVSALQHQTEEKMDYEYFQNSSR